MFKGKLSLRVVLIFAGAAIIFAVFIPVTALMMSGDSKEMAALADQTSRPIPVATVVPDGPGVDKPMPEILEMLGPFSEDRNLKDLPYIAPTKKDDEDKIFRRHVLPQTKSPLPSDPVQKSRKTNQPEAMPTPLATFAGMSSGQACGGCLPPDTDGDVGPNNYIQSVNSSFKIFNKSGAQLLAPTTYNSFFSALGTSTPCGNQNDGDGVVFYDHLADRWIISDFAFPGNFATNYQCIGVSKTGDPVAGGWWLYAMQIDPANPTWLGDYPKFGMWPDAYYMSVNLFDGPTSAFEGVRVYALPRTAMINGTGSPNPGALTFALTPATLGDAYSLVPASFRNGNAPPAGRPEYFMAVNSSTTAGTVENQVFTWKFHADFVTPANSTFGLGAAHTPDGTVTVAGFVDAFSATSTLLVPQNGTTRTLDTLGDKLMYPLIYQNLGGVESIYVAQTVNNNQGGTGPTAIRWYQFNTTANTIPSTPTQQQTYNNAADGMWRWMPSLNVDRQGNMMIGYAASSGTAEPSIRYAGRLAGDPVNTLAQGEAVMQTGAGHQTHSSGRWGDYSTMFVDPTDGCTFWHTNEYYSATSSAAWNTRIGNFKFPGCTATSLQKAPFDFDNDGKTDISIFRPGVGEWWYLRSKDGGNRTFQFGSSTDKLVPGDYTGDGTTDIAFYRKTTGEWFILRSDDFSFYSFPFGAAEDIPVPADYDGDGKTDAAVFRPSSNTWFIQNSNGTPTTITTFGVAGDRPVPADYDGDGKADIAIYRPASGQWWLNRSRDGGIVYNFWHRHG